MKIAIYDYYESLSTTDRAALRDRFIAECGIGYANFYNRMKKRNWKKVERIAIAPILEELNLYV